MPTKYIRDLGPKASEPAWRQAQGLLAASETLIGHIDTGLFAHKTLGYDAAGKAPDNILLDRGANVYDPGGSAGTAPVTNLTKGSGFIDKAAEFPDHGVKTLSIILANRPGELIGVAPGARIIPYRVANGPVFVGKASTGLIGRAMNHAMDQPNPPRVFSISMGNPGVTGIFEFLRGITGGKAGIEAEACDAINRAYEQGIIIVAAGGQVINQLVYPARFGRTISVGGIREDNTHYPTGGYRNSGEPDIWALAANINRAAGERQADGTIKQTHADDPGSTDAEPSGTSYAAPQVAAAAAMWVTRWSVELLALSEMWMIVEAFRKALRDSASEERIRASANSSRMIPVRRLDIDKLVRTPPDLTVTYDKRRSVSPHGSWL